MSDRALRQITLKLHALHVVDRDWVLGQLPEKVRRPISALLKELNALGIRSIPEAVDSSGFPISSVQLDVALIREIDKLDSATVFALLDDLPVRQKALLFHAYQWRWASTLWNRLADGERRRLVKTMEAMTLVRPAAMASVLASFLALVQERRVNRISAVRA